MRTSSHQTQTSDAHVMRTDPQPKKGKERTMRKYAFIATLISLGTLAFGASAQSQRCINKCNAGDPSNVTECLKHCGEAPVPTNTATTPTTTATTPTTTATTKTPPPKSTGTVQPNNPCTGANQVLDPATKTCVCAPNFVKDIVSCECVAICAEGEALDQRTNKCVKLGSGGSACDCAALTAKIDDLSKKVDNLNAKVDAASSALTNVGDGFPLWPFIVIICLQILDFIVMMFRTKKDEDETPPPAKPADKPTQPAKAPEDPKPEPPAPEPPKADEAPKADPKPEVKRRGPPQAK